MPNLTRTTILEMEAGPELDALVAEMVMGWLRGKRGNWVVVVPPNHEWLSDDGGWEPTTEEVTFPHEQSHIPAYSTDIAAAWEVVEKLIAADKLNLFVDFTEARERQDGPKWRCCLEAATYVGEGSTAPLAICRAALLATLEDAQ